MNQEKIGKFIAELRKERKMTQQELAEKMGVSINAVSKWERGLSFPDISLYKKLCKELNINIEELINGEKDSSKEAKEKAIISTIIEKNRIKKNSNKIIFSLIIIFCFIIISIFSYNNNLKVNLVNDSEELYNIVIEYLKDEEFKNNKDSTKTDFNVFYSYHGFGIEKKDNYKYVYMWIFNTSYYLETKDSLTISSTVSIPCKIIFKDNKILKVEYPKDGNEYISSVKKMFPNLIANQILNFDKVENTNKYFNEITERKNKYYNYLNFDMSKITIDDISDNNLIFSINIGSKNCIPVLLSIYKDNKYILSTAYKACRTSQTCTSELRYTKQIEGTYDFDIIQIIRHSIDTNHIQFNMDSLLIYDIYTGNGYTFITNNDNKYLINFLKSINVDLTNCAEPDYIN